MRRVWAISIRYLTLSLSLLTWESLLGQNPPETGRLLGELRERLAAYSEQAAPRRALLEREAETIRHLSNAGDAISTFATGHSYGEAGRKLEEARRVALADPPLPEPVPSVLTEIDRLIGRPQPGADPVQVRAKVFLEIAKVEEHLVELTESIHVEVQVVQGLLDLLSRTQGGLRHSAINGLKAAVHAQRLAIKR